MTISSEFSPRNKITINTFTKLLIITTTPTNNTEIKLCMTPEYKFLHVIDIGTFRIHSNKIHKLYLNSYEVRFTALHQRLKSDTRVLLHLLAHPINQCLVNKSNSQYFCCVQEITGNYDSPFPFIVLLLFRFTVCLFIQYEFINIHATNKTMTTYCFAN